MQQHMFMDEVNLGRCFLIVVCVRLHRGPSGIKVQVSIYCTIIIDSYVGLRLQARTCVCYFSPTNINFGFDIDHDQYLPLRMSSIQFETTVQIYNTPGLRSETGTHVLFSYEDCQLKCVGNAYFQCSLSLLCWGLGTIYAPVGLLEYTLLDYPNAPRGFKDDKLNSKYSTSTCSSAQVSTCM